VDALERRVAARRRTRDAGVVDQHVEPAELSADARGGGFDRRRSRDIELEGERISTELLGRSLAAPEVARTDRYREATFRELRGDGASDSLVGSNDFEKLS
jgi:hypothetical protein